MRRGCDMQEDDSFIVRERYKRLTDLNDYRVKNMDGEILLEIHSKYFTLEYYVLIVYSEMAKETIGPLKVEIKT